MTSFLFVGDPHFRAKASRWRIDSAYDVQLNKLIQILELGKKHEVDGIILLGDVVHSPNEPYTLVYDLINIFKKYKIPIYTLLGNHDITGYNLESIKSSPLGILLASGLIKLLDGDTEFSNKIVLRGIHYRADHAIDGYMFSEQYKYHLKLIAAHTMIIPQDSVPFSYIHPDNIKTNASMVISGHYHLPFDYTTPNFVRYINPGIFMRWTMDEKDLTPKVLYLLVNFADGIHTYTTQYLSLGAKPGDEVFNVTKVAELKEKEQTIENFIKTLENTTFSGANLEETIISYGQTQGIETEVVENLLKRIREKRGLRI